MSGNFSNKSDDIAKLYNSLSDNGKRYLFGLLAQEDANRQSNEQKRLADKYGVIQNAPANFWKDSYTGWGIQTFILQGGGVAADINGLFYNDIPENSGVNPFTNEVVNRPGSDRAVEYATALFGSLAGSLTKVVKRGDQVVAKKNLLDSFTASGDTVHHGKHSTAFGSDSATVNNFNKATNSNKGHNAIVHGSLDYDELGGIPVINGKETSPSQIARAIRENPNYVEGTQVCFGSCWSGASGTAQELANEIGAPVFAPTRPVMWDTKADSWVFDTDIYPIQGLRRPDIKPEWKMFYPKNSK